jgi:predicted Zn-ribbon and HTH transcriptional regulator
MQKPSERIKEIVLERNEQVYGTMTVDRAEIYELKRILNGVVEYLDEISPKEPWGGFGSLSDKITMCGQCPRCKVKHAPIDIK